MHSIGLQQRLEPIRRYLIFAISVLNNWFTIVSFLAVVIAPIFKIWVVLAIALIIAIISALCKAFILKEQQSVVTVQNLKKELESAAKSRRLLDLCPDAKFRIVQVFEGPSGKLSIIMYGERACRIDEGTLFQVYRTDQLTVDGLAIPRMIGIVNTMPIIIEGGPFEAELQQEYRDKDFWRSVRSVIFSGQSYNPPRNEARPYIPPRLSHLSAVDMEAFAKVLVR